MTDVHTQEQRSRNMAAIKGRYNKSTELTVVKMFRSAGIQGWRRHFRNLPGTPDFVFPKQKVAIFADGCFWHGCPRCAIYPKSNKSFWNKKIKDNRLHDKKMYKLLTQRGWKVLRFWEHDIEKKPQDIINKIKRVLSA